MARELWLSNDKERWVAALGMYDEAIAALAKEKKKPGLVALDTWWREELPLCLREREAKGGAYITLKELERVMEWKLTRGKFRPLMGRIKGNDKHKVEDCSRRAFALLASHTNTHTTKQEEGDDASWLRGSLEAVSELGGVGPATASAILATYRPGVVCFMEDACMSALWPDKPMAYTLPQFLKLQAALAHKSTQLSLGPLGAEGVGRALWAAHIAHKLGLAGGQDQKAGSSSSKAKTAEEDGSEDEAQDKKKKATKKHKQDDDEEKEKEKPKRRRK